MMASPKPSRVRRETTSLSTKCAPAAMMSGIMATIMPAWEAEVRSMARASNTKYMHGSHRAMNSRGFQSPGR